MKNHLSLYLERYAETQAIAAAQVIPRSLGFKYCIVIPAFDENTEFLSRLKQSSIAQQNVLFILNINQPDIALTSDKNQTLWKFANSSGRVINRDQDNSYLINWTETNSHLLVINCFSDNKKIKAKYGVGLARKIACDAACFLIHKGILKSNWIHNTDADALLPEDYFLTADYNDRDSAIIYPYRHIPAQSSGHTDHSSSSIYAATQVVEQSLDYYVNGLRYAKSPYAYHSLGSCIAVNAQFYAQARGFPKRAGGEDFYLLNKLRKLGAIKTNNQACILLESRVSPRVPFGTGPAVNEVLIKQLTLDSYPYYKPHVFITLKRLIKDFEELADNKNKSYEWLNHLPKTIQTVLESININQLSDHLDKHTKHEYSHRLRNIHDWFDGFKTLKFIHNLERIAGEKYRRVNLSDAIETLTILEQQDQEQSDSF